MAERARVDRIAAAAKAREPLRSGETTAYRLINGEADGLPDVTLDWFDGVGVVSLYALLDPDEEAALVDAVGAALAPRSLYLKRRPREARVVANTQRDKLAPEIPVFGEPVPERVVRENGLSFLIRPPQGLSVGLYLDMRDTRQWVREHAKGRTVLNCFSYTCGFAIAARAGGAVRAVNVDLSRRVLDWGIENARLNGQPAERQDHIASDVFQWLGRMARREERIDLVIVDPPSFSTSKRGAFSAASDYPRLAEAAAKVVAGGGSLVACCNLSNLTAERFEAMVQRGLTKAGRRSRKVSRLGASTIDFPALPGIAPALKVLVVELD